MNLRGHMIAPVYCQIRIKGHLSDKWSNWFDGLAIDNGEHGEAVLSGTLADQAALYGVLNRMRDLGVELISMSCRKAEENRVGQQS